MISEFCERVLTEIQRTGAWPHIDGVRAAMEKVTAEMEADAMANPIASALVSIETGLVDGAGIDPIKTPLDEISERSVLTTATTGLTSTQILNLPEGSVHVTRSIVSSTSTQTADLTEDAAPPASPTHEIEEAF